MAVILPVPFNSARKVIRLVKEEKIVKECHRKHKGQIRALFLGLFSFMKLELFLGVELELGMCTENIHLV